MALVHYLYIGHFIPEQGYVRFQDHKPAVTRPLESTPIHDFCAAPTTSQSLTSNEELFSYTSDSQFVTFINVALEQDRLRSDKIKSLYMPLRYQSCLHDVR